MTVFTSCAFVFPGQGSQRVGMLRSLPDQTRILPLLESAETLTGFDLRAIAESGPDAALADTRAAQPLLYIADLAWACAVHDAGIRPSAVAGHSLGELAALTFAGALSAEDGLRLVCERARIMSEVAAVTPGTMAAVLGMDQALVADLIEGLPGVWVANDNGPGQVVISGTHEGVEGATHALTAAGARRVVPLPVAGPFHCPLMAPAAEAFASVLEAYDFVDTVVGVVQNTAPTLAHEGHEIRRRLAAQIPEPVRWTDTMDALVSSGVRVLVECGPGSVLTGLARRMDGLDGVSAETDGIEKVLEVVS